MRLYAFLAVRWTLILLFVGCSSSSPPAMVDAPVADAPVDATMDGCSMRGGPCYMVQGGAGCCAGFVCPFGDTAASGVHGCQPCGNMGEFCCGNNDTCNAADLRCAFGSNGNSLCSPCGNVSEVCCANDFCKSGLRCDGLFCRDFGDGGD